MDGFTCYSVACQTFTAVYRFENAFHKCSTGNAAEPAILDKGNSVLVEISPNPKLRKHWLRIGKEEISVKLSPKASRLMDRKEPP